jgi:hypothetical protein
MMKNNYDYKRVNNDANGNPRYVVHFLPFVNSKDEELAELLSKETRPFKYPIDHLYDIAVTKAKAIGGKKYRGKDFGGGVVFSSVYHLEEEIFNHIPKIKES